MAAMWLTIAAPVVSQTLATRGFNLGGEHAGHMGHPSSPHPHAPVVETCGYCGLLGHNPVLGGVAWLPPVLPPTADIHSDRSDTPRWVPHSPLAAAPRGPPMLVNA